MLPYVTPTPTPLWDRLLDATAGDPLRSYNARRDVGGEWDTLAATPLRKRQRLTSAGLMSVDGTRPDVFCDMLRRYVGSEVEPDPIAWYVRTALRALDEKQAAALRDYRRRVTRAAGVRSYYEVRLLAAMDATGTTSYWAYRRSRGWKENRRR